MAPTPGQLPWWMWAGWVVVISPGLFNVKVTATLPFVWVSVAWPYWSIELGSTALRGILMLNIPVGDGLGLVLGFVVGAAVIIGVAVGTTTIVGLFLLGWLTMTNPIITNRTIIKTTAYLAPINPSYYPTVKKAAGNGRNPVRVLPVFRGQVLNGPIDLVVIFLFH